MPTILVGKAWVEPKAGLSRLFLKPAWWSRGLRYVYVDLKEGDSELVDFFGASHYVEVNDQLFGRFGGIGSMRRDGDDIELTLTYDLDSGARALRIRFARRPDGEVSKFLEDLERAV